MIRGISKKIIEVNDTGSEMFEKALFFVKCDCSLDDKLLKNEANKIINTYFENENNNNQIKEGFLRYTERKKRNIKKIILGSFVVLICIVIALILKVI